MLRLFSIMIFLKNLLNGHIVLRDNDLRRSNYNRHLACLYSRESKKKFINGDIHTRNYKHRSNVFMCLFCWISLTLCLLGKWPFLWMVNGIFNLFQSYRMFFLKLIQFTVNGAVHLPVDMLKLNAKNDEWIWLL